jgi:nitronate monooxygenase
MPALAPLLQRLGMRLPIIQAPMAGVSTPQMAAAVCNSGGLGSLGLGASSPSTARTLITELQSLTSKAFNVNVFVHAKAVPNVETTTKWLDTLRPHFAKFGAEPPTDLREIYKSFNDDTEMLEVLCDLRPAVVSFHFGLPPTLTLDRLRKKGIVLFASVTSLDEARQAQKAGIDALIAQGYEAGGHRGIFDPSSPDSKLSTVSLVRLLVRKVETPIIAAGGIMDGAGINAMLELGAIAAQLGTAFVATPESAADDHYREALFSTAAEHTVMTTSISGRPARSLRNEFTQMPVEIGAVVPDYPLTYDVGKALNAAAKAKGEGGYGAQWAGQGAPLARRLGCAELMAKLEKEMHWGS